MIYNGENLRYCSLFCVKTKNKNPFLCTVIWIVGFHEQVSSVKVKIIGICWFVNLQ